MPKELTNGYCRIGEQEYEAAVYHKYLENIKAGRRQMTYGPQPEFRGFSPDLNNGISLRAFFTQQTENDMIERVSNPLSQLAESYGIRFHPTTLPLHITLSDLRWTPQLPITREEAFGYVLDDARIPSAISLLENMAITFDVLWGGSNIVLAAFHIPDPITKAREIMRHIQLDNQLGDTNLSNIVHVTMARVAGSDSQIQRGDFQKFGQGIMRIHWDLLRNPLVAHISEASIMSNQMMNGTTRNNTDIK